MSRFMDRILAAGGARAPMSLDYMADVDGGPRAFLAELVRDFPHWFLDVDLRGVDLRDALTVSSLVRTEELRRLAGRPKWEFGSVDRLRGLPVFAGDWVPEWIDTMPTTEAVRDFAGPLLQPFSTFWIEVETRGVQFRDLQRYYAWGALISEMPRPRADAIVRGFEQHRGMKRTGADLDAATPYAVELFVEPTKGDPVGPIGESLMFVDPQGELVITHEPDICFLHAHRGVHTLIVPEMRSAAVDTLIGPLLTTWGLTNVEREITIETQRPKDALSKKHQRKTGEPLVTYHDVILSAKLRRVVERATGEGIPIGRALHWVRASEAFYSEESPLFGRKGDPRFTGWVRRPGTLRGNPEFGEVHTTYRPERPESPGGIGR